MINIKCPICHVDIENHSVTETPSVYYKLCDEKYFICFNDRFNYSFYLNKDYENKFYDNYIIFRAIEMSRFSQQNIILNDKNEFLYKLDFRIISDILIPENKTEPDKTLFNNVLFSKIFTFSLCEDAVLNFAFEFCKPYLDRYCLYSLFK